MAKHKFGLGNKFGKGGARPGAGRKPDELKQWLIDLAHDPKNRVRLKKILEDAEDAEEKVTEQGVCVPTRARADTYLRALELTLNYALGKPAQTVTATDGQGNAVPCVVVLAPHQVGQAGGVNG